MQKKNTRITNVHGSMEGQDILSKVESIEKEKQRKVVVQYEKKQKKEEENEMFYKWKSKCVCEGVCAAKDLKECSQCDSVMRSACSKANCQKDGKKPVMIRAASSTTTTRKRQADVASF